jgi:hypothetical protein
MLIVDGAIKDTLGIIGTAGAITITLWTMLNGYFNRQDALVVDEMGVLWSPETHAD